MHLTPAEWDWVIRLAAIGLGFFLKAAPWYETKFIPIASFVLSLVIRLALGLGVEVPTAALDATVSTGLFSGVKNILQGVSLVFKLRKGAA